MRSCMHCECWILVNCDATIEWERSGKVRKPGYLKALWRNRQSNHMRALVAGDPSDAFKASLRFVIALFANFGDLDEILQLSISEWHSTFCKSYLLASADIRHFVIATWHSNLNLHPQNAALGDRCLPFPWLRHCLQDRIKSFSNLCIQPNIVKSKQATKTAIMAYASKQKPELDMQRNIEPSAIFFQAFNSVIRSFTGSSSQCFEAPTALRLSLMFNFYQTNMEPTDQVKSNLS